MSAVSTMAADGVASTRRRPIGRGRRPGRGREQVAQRGDRGLGEGQPFFQSSQMAGDERVAALDRRRGEHLADFFDRHVEGTACGG
jgi:hypothetical protein